MKDEKPKPTVEYQVLRGRRPWCDVHVFEDERQAKAFMKKGDEVRTVMRHAPPIAKPKRGSR